MVAKMVIFSRSNPIVSEKFIATLCVKWAALQLCFKSYAVNSPYFAM